MIVAVTGGSGFIGQNLIRRLLADGHDVRCLVRSASARAVPAGARSFVVDFDVVASLRDCEALEDADVIFHLAGATRAVDRAAFHRANVTPVRHLLGALTARRLSPRFVFVSSQAAAGPAVSLAHPVEESDEARPIEPYGASKLEAERVVATFSDRVPATVVRPCAVFGPWDKDFFTLFRLARRGLLVYPGTAAHWLSLLHVDDVVAGLISAATSERAVLRTYFLSSSAPIRWRTLGDAIAAAMGMHARHVDLPRFAVVAASLAGHVAGIATGHVPLANPHKARLARASYWVCSGVRARTELHFRESRSLPEAIAHTYLWYVEHGWLRGARSTVAPVA